MKLAVSKYPPSMAYHLTPLGRTALRKSKTAYPRFNGCESGFRFFSPGIGRWASRDPIGERGGLNLFSICENNSVQKCDRTGKQTILGGTSLSFSVDDLVFIPDDCGHFSWSVLWKVRGPSPLWGSVVQEMTMTSSITDCQGHPINDPDQHYWEAWSIVDASMDDPPRDTWAFSDPGGLPCSSSTLLPTLMRPP